MEPPLQPMLPFLEQSTSCCSDMETSLPVPICHAPSMPPVVEKAQHEPHWPWSLTGVTAPASTQLTEEALVSGKRVGVLLEAPSMWPEYPSICLYSAWDQSENWLWPAVHPALELLCS